MGYRVIVVRDAICSSSDEGHDLLPSRHEFPQLLLSNSSSNTAVGRYCARWAREAETTTGNYWSGWQKLPLLCQRFRCLQMVLQGWQRLLRKIGERTLRLRLFLVFPDVLHVIADHLLHELIIELVAGELAKPVVHGFLSCIRLWGDRHADLQWIDYCLRGSGRHAAVSIRSSHPSFRKR